MQKGQGSGNFDSDSTRMCPVCRMSISVLATKCRFCGENVGRPRVEDRHLSISDLGGETKHEHTASETIMDALEAFRVEEFSQGAAPPEDERPSGIFRRGKGKKSAPESPAQTSVDDIPDLSDKSRAFTAEIHISGARDKSAPGARRSGKRNWLLWGVVAALVVACIGGGLTIAKIRAYRNARNRSVPIQHVNRALAILEGADESAVGHQVALQALAAAKEALEKDNSDENRQIADTVRERLAEEVRGLLDNTDSFSQTNLAEALDTVSRALGVDGGNETIRALKDEVDEEDFAYNKMILEQVADDLASATITYVYPSNPNEKHRVVVRENDRLRERFVVKKITKGYVKLEDTKRQSRMSKNRMVKVLRDGSVK